MIVPGVAALTACWIGCPGDTVSTVGGEEKHEAGSNGAPVGAGLAVGLDVGLGVALGVGLDVGSGGGLDVGSGVGLVAGVNFHCWLPCPWQVQICSRVPLAELKPVASRHFPSARTVPSPWR